MRKGRESRRDALEGEGGKKSKKPQNRTMQLSAWSKPEYTRKQTGWGKGRVALCNIMERGKRGEEQKECDLTFYPGRPNFKKRGDRCGAMKTSKSSSGFLRLWNRGEKILKRAGVVRKRPRQVSLRRAGVKARQK